jgi:hypothetical protein
LDSLAEILWRSSSKGREFVVEQKGIDSLNKAMWADMENASVLEAAMHLILAMAASPDGKNDMLSDEDSICDSVLFTMQSHANVPGIQLKGCLIFSCLAAASADNKTISDGSLSGAVMLVLNAMSIHQKSRPIQKAGILALHHQCVLSVHAEGNKRTLMDSKLDNGISGPDVLFIGMQEMQQDYVAMEWACRICWCLTSSEDLVKSSANTPLHEAIIPICEFHMNNPAAMGLVEAALGAIGNLAHVERKRSELCNVGAFRIIIDSLRDYGNDFGISYEAISAIANFSVSPHARDSLVKSGVVPIIVDSLQNFIEFPEYVSEALRALVCLAAQSKEAKLTLATEGVVGLVATASSKHGNSRVQEMCCSLLATLTVGPATTSEFLVKNGAVNIILSAMDDFPELKVQEAACCALRNLSCQIQYSDTLFQRGDTERCIINAMDTYENSVSVQINACCTLWNMLFKAQEESHFLSAQGVKSIVKAMQSHMESGELLELACGALWTVVDDSMDRKKDFVANGAIDAVTCAIVMHPERTATLEKACGVLSNVSSEGPLADAIANAQGVSIVAEAMRNNSSSVELLEVGCLTLRNIVYMFPDLAQEASPAISSVISAMKDNVDAVGFQQEACNLLWILAAEEESCKSKIVALDGLGVLMKCLEDPQTQKSALGAFNQLASNNNQTETY